MTDENPSSQIGWNFAQGTLLLSIFTLVVQVIGLATNGWWIAYVASLRNYDRRYSYRIEVGLWTIKYCFDNICGLLSNEGFWEKYDIFEDAVITDVTEFRVETCLGVALMLIVVLSAIILKCIRLSNLSHSRSTRIVTVMCVCSGLSGIMALTAAGRVGKANYDRHKDPLLPSPLLVPYSVYTTGGGGVLAIVLFMITAIKIVLNLKRARSEGRGPNVTMDTYPPNGR